MKTDYLLHSAETAPERSRLLLEQVQDKYGMIPNLHRVMASSPSLLQAYMEIDAAFASSSLTPVERQVVYITTSVTNGCTYCVAAHSVISDKSGIPLAVTDALRDGTVIPDTKLEALRVFTQQLVEKRGWVEPEVIEHFYAAGYNQQSLLDVIVGVGQKTVSNYMNHLSSTPLDDVFSSRQWTATTFQ